MRRMTRIGIRLLLAEALAAGVACSCQTIPVPSHRRVAPVAVPTPQDIVTAYEKNRLEELRASGAVPVSPLACPSGGPSYVGVAIGQSSDPSATPPLIFTIDPSSKDDGFSIDSATGVVTAPSTLPEDEKSQDYSVLITVTDSTGKVATNTCKVTISSPSGCYWTPLRRGCMGSGATRVSNVNSFFDTSGTLSYANQLKAIYNGASSSATVSADLATLNFPVFQVTAGTNIQAGSAGNAPTSTATPPTLTSAAAAQAAQNILYGGTIFGQWLWPFIAGGGDKIGSPGGLGFLVDFVAREGVDIQNFKSGTSTTAVAPPSHASVQIEGYLSIQLNQPG